MKKFLIILFLLFTVFYLITGCLPLISDVYQQLIVQTPTAIQIQKSPTFETLVEASKTLTPMPNSTPNPESTALPNIHILDEKQFTSTKSNRNSITNANYIREIFVDQENNVWSVGNGGVVYWDIKHREYMKYTVEHGLASNDVTSIAQACNGDLWFGTFGNGVSKFNHIDWTTYTNKDGLIDNEILSIAVDMSCKIWVGTTRGVSTYDGETWTSYNGVLTGDPVGRADKIVSTSNGGVWLGSLDSTLRYYDGKMWTIFDGQFIGDRVTALSIDENNTLWVGTEEGISQYDGQQWQFYPVTAKTNQQISSIAFTENKFIWVGLEAFSTPDMPREALGYRSLSMRTGVIVYDKTNWTQIDLPEDLIHNEFRSIGIASDNSVWLGSYNSGLFHYDSGSINIYRTKDNMLSNFIEVLGISADNKIVWLGHPEGVSRLSLNENNWSTFAAIGDIQESNISIRALAIDKDDFVSIGTHGSIATLSETGWNTFNLKEDLGLKSIATIKILTNGSILVGGNKGIFEFDGQSWYKIFDAIVNSVNVMVSLDDETIWVGTSDGTYKCEMENNLCTQIANLNSDSIAIADNGTLWFANCRELSTNGSDEYSYIVKYPGTGCIYDIAISHQNILWVGTSDGLFIFNYQNQTWNKITNGLAGIKIHDIEISTDGLIWIATESGLYQYDPNK